MFFRLQNLFPKHFPGTYVLIIYFCIIIFNYRILEILFYIVKTIFYKGIMPSEKGFRFSSGL